MAEPPGPGATLRAGDWAGVRGRFWAMLARPDGAGAAVEPRPGPGVALVAPAAPGPAPTEWRYTFYAGPVERRGAGPRGSRARAPAPLRASGGGCARSRSASSGCSAGWTAWLGHPGVAIIALAVSVKMLLLPLAAFAERLQEQVNATQARLQPGLDAINAAHRGEERTRRTLALYRELGVHPLYTLQSLAGFLIQIPVFIAVFDMLAEDFDLYRVPFLWIRDLSRPDAVAALPACVPFFGCELNLLPFLMSGVSLATLLRFRSPVLTPALVRRQRRNLAGMTLLFFLLFYTFPAGMVLYWTSTNAFQLAEPGSGALVAGPPGERASGRAREGRVDVGDQADQAADVEGLPVLRAPQADDHEPTGGSDDDALALGAGGEERVGGHAAPHPEPAELAVAAVGEEAGAVAVPRAGGGRGGVVDPALGQDAPPVRRPRRWRRAGRSAPSPARSRTCRWSRPGCRSRRTRASPRACRAGRTARAPRSRITSSARPPTASRMIRERIRVLGLL